MRTVYCDESGFTGNRLMDEDQPIFAFAGVCMAPDRAEAYVRELAEKHKLKATEFKGGSLCKRQRGQAVVRQVIEELADHAQVAFANKKYALCGKMFEYLIEPAVSPVNSLLYDIKFHKFVANVLYAFMIAQKASAESVFGRFEDALRGRTDRQLIAIPGTPAVTAIDLNDFVDNIITFLICNRKKIAEEVILDEPQRAGGWMLELSTTSLRSILVAFGADMEPMEVYCDESKPIADQTLIFDVMVGRTDVRKVPFAGRMHQVTFNLDRKIEMVDSRAYPGVQLADIFASATTFALNNPGHELSDVWFEHSEKFVHVDSVVPQLEFADLTRPDVAVSAMVFHELLNRSILGQPYLTDMREIIGIAQAGVAAEPERFPGSPADEDDFRYFYEDEDDEEEVG